MPASFRAALDAVLPSREEIRAMRFWDGHVHLTTPGATPEERLRSYIALADNMGLDRLILARGVPPYPREPNRAEMRKQNDDVMRAIRAYPDRALGTVYLNPHELQASLDELNRCVRDGPCVGVKLWVAAKVNIPNLDPIVARAQELKAVLFQHTWVIAREPGAGPADPNASTPDDLVETAGRHPGASFVSMHSGGNWELGIRTMRNSPNVALEISGSTPTAGFVEMAVREVGATRVTYGTDTSGRSMSTQMAKVLGADITPADKLLVCGANLRRLFEPIMRAKGMPLD
jgi:predicted TIM-barrel fold metal-dependent hydrolase